MAFVRDPPQLIETIQMSYPAPNILLVTLNRGYNMLNTEMHEVLSLIWRWYDLEPSLRCAIFTGSNKSFCAGADLKQWLLTRKSTEVIGGFGGLSRRIGKKPIIAAVNGLCLGGGMEMAVNCDLVVASERAEFGLPEVKRGVFAKQGALGRIVRFVGLQRASELALLGDSISPQTAYSWGLVNVVVPHDQLIPKAIDWAKKIGLNSPDSIIVSRMGILAGLEHGSLERGTQVVNESAQVATLEAGDNIEEGLRAFKEKRATKWKDSKL